ncbi:MAG: hypothetical protein P8I13_04205 [Porticoccaceae bacterium]|nr:hypothetical protein [Porticoccaceae bacterium]
MEFLLLAHISAGIVALLSATLALCSGKGGKLHRLSGAIYFWAMSAIFITAIPMAIITGNIFLFLIAIFSFYLAFAGRRFAKNRKGIATIIDWVAIGLVLISGIAMWILAVIYFLAQNYQYITLGVFGFIALAVGYQDYMRYKNRTVIGKRRIAGHLTHMMGGTIAVVTAVLVVNVSMEPTWLWWILPTLVITPIIFWWNIKTLDRKN